MEQYTFDPADVGRRIQSRRESLSKSRATIAQLCGHGESWLKKIERGERSTTLRELYQLASVLEVRDLSVLTGSPIKLEVNPRPAHPALQDVSVAMTSKFYQRDAEPATVKQLRKQLDDAWRTWHNSPTQRTAVSQRLPRLITSMKYAARTHEGAESRRAYALLAETYHLTQAFLAWQSASELVWLSTDRGMTAAESADDPVTLAGSASYYAAVLRGVSRSDEAIELVMSAARDLEPRLADEPEKYLPMWGTLHLSASITAARAGLVGEAWGYLDKAATAARKLPAGYYHPWDMFGQANVDLWGVAVAVEVGQTEGARRRAEDIDLAAIPSLERRARHLIEISRTYFQQGDHTGAVHLLGKSETVSPEVVKYNVIARSMLKDMVRQSRASVREDVEALAARTGVLAEV